jgi:asparagine synthase (glutamine-hydrolysing)
VWVPEQICIWNEVRKLAPGHYLHVRANGEFTLNAFWHFNALIADNMSLIRDEHTAIDTIDKVLFDSVTQHLVADVPINAFLSGGLDSSLLVAMARKQLDTLDCYTIKFRDQDQKQEAMADDAVYAAKVAKVLGVRLNTIEVAPDVSQLLPRIVNTLDEPIGDSAAINTLLICEAARDNGVKVLLSGMGADEMFGGYRKHLANLVAARYRLLPSVLRDSVIAPLINRLPVASAAGGLKLARWAKRFVEFASLPEHEAFLRSYSYYNHAELDALMHGGSRQIAPLIAAHEATFAAAGQRSLLDRMCFTDVQWFMTSLNLAYSDRASMAASTEVRVPFIDKEVITAAFRIDSRLKIKGRTQKYILKKVAERWLPHEIIYRPKSSFTMPLRGWIKGELRGMVDDYVLSQRGLAGRDFFDAQALRDIVERDRRGTEDNAQRIWQLLTLEQWFRNKGV